MCMPKLTKHHTFVLEFEWVTGVWSGPEASKSELMANVGCMNRDEPQTNIFHSHLSQCSLHATTTFTAATSFVAVSCEACEGVQCLPFNCLLKDQLQCVYA